MVEMVWRCQITAAVLKVKTSFRRYSWCPQRSDSTKVIHKLNADKGLVVIKRSNEHPDKYEEEDVKPINVSFDCGQPYVPPCENPAAHGLLSLFKNSPNRKIRLAICICVYSEPKHMLKSTIKGIQ